MENYSGNAWSRANDELKNVFQEAKNVAESYGARFLASEFALVGILRTGGVACRLLVNYGVNEPAVRALISRENLRNSSGRYLAPGMSAAINRAYEISAETNCSFISPEHFLLAILEGNSVANSLLRSVSDDYDGLYQKVKDLVIGFSDSSKKGREARRNSETDYAEKGEEHIEKRNEYDKFEQVELSVEGTPLEGFGTDLTEKARRGRIDPVIGREKETERIINTLSRRQKNNPLLIGEPGTGKSAVVEGLATRIADGNVPLPLKNKILFSLDMTSVIAGAKFHGEFEDRFKKILDYVTESDDIILFIDEIHTLVAGNKGDTGAAEILKPVMARGDIKIIGATTISEYVKYIEKDPALERRFQTVLIEPPSAEASIEIIKGLRENFEAHHRVAITNEAIEAAVNLSDRYITDRFLPDKAIDLIDEACAAARLLADAPVDEVIEKEAELKKEISEYDYAVLTGGDVQSHGEKINRINQELEKLYDRELKKQSRSDPYIDGDDVARVVAEKTGIPVARLTETEAAKLMNLEEQLHQRVVGQDKAIRSVARAVRRAMSGIKDPGKPIGTFLFVGPTGVGKTELTKALAEALFGDENMLVRIDMSEYMEKSSVAKLIGAPPGYVGYDEEGQLTEKVRRKPYSVVLFDETEKAHADIFNIMLQIFDDGRLTDSKGRTVDFKNTVIIMTSNAGASSAERKPLGFGADAEEVSLDERINAALKKTFKPEFLNRIDEIIVFEKLTREECRKITSFILENLRIRLKKSGITFSYDERLKDFVLDNGFDGEYGARPLKRTVQRLVEDPLSEKIISGEVRKSGRIKATVENGRVVFYTLE